MLTLTSKRSWSVLPSCEARCFYAASFPPEGCDEISHLKASIFYSHSKRICRICKHVCFMIQRSLAKLQCNMDSVYEELICETHFLSSVFTCSWSSWSQAITAIIKYLIQTSPNDESCRMLINSSLKNMRGVWSAACGQGSRSRSCC